MIIKEII